MPRLGDLPSFLSERDYDAYTLCGRVFGAVKRASEGPMIKTMICAPVSMTHKFDCDWGVSRLLCCDLD